MASCPFQVAGSAAVKMSQAPLGHERAERSLCAFSLAGTPAFAYGQAQSDVIQRAALSLLELYRWLLSPLLPGSCRFEPSCSRYATGCIENHGVLRGCVLTFLRLCKCHPFHPGGYDPPPPPRRAEDLTSHGK